MMELDVHHNNAFLYSPKRVLVFQTSFAKRNYVGITNQGHLRSYYMQLMFTDNRFLEDVIHFSLNYSHPAIRLTLKLTGFVL